MIEIVIGAIGLWVITVVSVWIGFRMGRRTQGQPLPPIIKETTGRTPDLINEDPYFRPMHGCDQPSVPTVEERIA